MTFNDLSISESAIETTGVQSQPDTLTGTAAENKLVFDALPQLIVARFNMLITQLQAQAAAEQLGVTPFTGMTATNLQDALEALQTNLTQAIAGVGTGLAGSSGAASVGFDSTEQITAVTVQAAIEVVQQHLDAFKTQMTGSGGAASVGTGPISGLDATNVQAALAELRDDIQNIVSGIIPGGTITTNMLADGSVTAAKLNVTGEDIPTSTTDATSLSSQLSNLNSVLGGATTPQAALNALGAGVRPNLLDNAIFIGGGSQQGGGQLPINQRGQTSYSGVGTYCIDRWYRGYTDIAVLTLHDGYIEMVGDTNAELIQRLNNLYLGQTLTASVLLQDGTLFSATGTMPEAYSGGYVNTDIYNTIPNTGGAALNLSYYENRLCFIIICPSGSNVEVVAAKLEIGDTQTLAYQDDTGAWQLLPQPESDYATQLIKCLYYYWDSDSPGYGGCSGIAINPTTLMCNVQFPIPMRTIPSVMLYGNGEVNKVRSTGDGTLISIPSSGSYARNKSGIAFIYCHGSSIFTTSMGYDFRIVANAEL